MPQNFVTIQNISYKVLTQRKVWKIWCVDKDERQRTYIDGWTSMDKCRWTKGPDEIVMVVGRNGDDVGWNRDKCWMKQGRTLDGMGAHVGRNGDGCWTKWWRMSDGMGMKVGWNDDKCWTKRWRIADETATVIGRNDATIVRWNCTEPKWTLRQNGTSITS